jgi:nicotinate phosphoribosyltransferase
MHGQRAGFDLFFRKNPFQGSYAVFAGLEPALNYLEQLAFSDDDLIYLKSLGIFRANFIDYLRTFRFRGRVVAAPEGTVVFANEPILTVEGTLGEAQLVESALLNIINFQTLIATKAARIKQAAGHSVVVEFGLRRAQGPDGALGEVRAAYVGGVRSTSNVWAGQLIGVPVKGTHAHSWVMAFEDELEAFRAYAAVFPDSAILLVDTYDTLKSGVPNAITVAGELRRKGHELVGIRLDSGDLAYLSKTARQMLDEAGFPAVKIVASSDLDEYVIESIRNEGGRIDIYGVGTRLATAAGVGGGALGGVYKLVSYNGEPRLKVTSDIAKATLPGDKSLLRLVDHDGTFVQDVICRAGERPAPGSRVFDPTNPLRRKILPPDCHYRHIRQVVMDGGGIRETLPSLEACADHCAGQLSCLPEGTLRLHNPHRYKVSISSGLHELCERLMSRYEA